MMYLILFGYQYMILLRYPFLYFQAHTQANMIHNIGRRRS